ncbi:MAG: MFS transporter [Gemmataceae bacterium]|nr:MFS transporter [Gemmataceae bacterium]
MSSAPASPAPPVSAWRWWVCALLMLATVVNYMDRMALNQTAKRIMTSLHLNNQQYSWLEGVFSLAFAIGALTTGYVVDRASVRWVYPLMVLGWSAAGVLTGFASGFWMLLGCRFALGFFEAGNWPCGIRTTRAVLRPEERSFGNSLFQSGTALGAVITPLLVLFLLRWADPDEGFRTAATAAVGGTYAATIDAPTDTWRFPFRVIGGLGVVWVVLWFATIPGRLVAKREEAPTAPGQGATRFADVFRDPRFWVLFALVVTINVTWHGYRTWLPLYLQKQRGFTEAEMSGFTTAYYLVADVGSWTVGLGTLLLCRRGLGVHAARTLAFAGCTGLTLAAVAVPFLPSGWQLEAGLLAVAFGALGMFPTYFALTQELSAKHQGKVTGTLGAGAHGSLFLIYPIEGWVIDRTGENYELILAAVGAAPLVGLALMLWLWPPRSTAGV